MEKDDMAGDAVDWALWAILGIGIVFIGCGCILTAGPKKTADLPDRKFDHEIDRAA